MHPGVPGVPSLPDLPDPAAWTTWWTWDPLVIAGLVASAVLYTAGTARLWRHAGAAHGIKPWHAVAHGAGLVVLAAALLSPLDRASDVLFSAHMAQHEMLMLVAAPLIVLGRPVVPLLWTMPRSWRVGAMRAAKRPRAVAVWRFLTSPVVALGLHAAARWLWHVPGLFDAALADERIHAVQHLTMFATAVLFWWTLIHGRYGRASYGIGVVFVFFTILHSGLLAAMLSLADHPLYAHGARTIRWGLDAVADQQRAGLVMWVPAGVIMMGIGIAIFAAWLGQLERTVEREESP